MKALLVDDERLARTQLRGQLAHFPTLQVVAEADSVERAVEAVEKHRPDVVFLDIQMPGSTGFDFLEQASGDFEVIFVTAFDRFAMRAFEVNALDYLLKPVRVERLSAALRRLPSAAEPSPSVREEIGPSRTDGRARHAVPLLNGGGDAAGDDGARAASRLNVGSGAICAGSTAALPLRYSDYLFVSSGASARFLKIRSIKYIVAAGSYSEVYAADGRKWMLLQPIKNWEERLPPAQFVRTHRSAIVNLDYVERVDALGNDTFQIYLHGQPDPLPISRRFARIVKDRFR
jgi:two-component system, LytTR family, response regulator